MKRLLLAAILSSLHAQSTFEAASIKINHSGRPGGGINVMPARIKVINSSLKFCIEVAWDVKDFQVSGGSSWIEADRYDIDAVAAVPFQKNEYRIMLQSLLTDRFGLEIHRETKDKPGYALVVAKSGPKLPPAAGDPETLFSRTATGDITFAARDITMNQLATALSGNLGSKVIDDTGLDGRYNASLQWTPDASNLPLLSKSGEPLPPPPADVVPGPSIFTALQEKLGLKLESRKVPVEVIVIDRAHHPSEN